GQERAVWNGTRYEAGTGTTTVARVVPGEGPLAPAPAGPAGSVARRETRVLEASPKSQQAASRRDTGSLIPRGDPLHLAPVKEQPAATTRAEPAGPQPALPHPVAMTFGIRRASDAPRPARQPAPPPRERVP